MPLPDTQCLTSLCVNIKVLLSGYKLTVLSGYEVLITLTYYLATTSSGVSKCDALSVCV